MAERFPALKARDIMTAELRYVDKDTSIKEAATRIINEGIGALLVTENGSPVGIVTKRDIIWSVLFEKRDPEKDTVAKIMSTPIITVNEDASLKEIVELMLRNNISHLPVREKNKLIGMISDEDLLETLLDMIEYLESLSVKKRE
jgi:CBS domain-containing protein